MLFGYGKAEDPERSFPFFHKIPNLRGGLAHAFFQQGKYTSALVMVEDPMKRPYPQWSFYKVFLSEFYNYRFIP